MRLVFSSATFTLLQVSDLSGVMCQDVDDVLRNNQVFGNIALCIQVEEELLTVYIHISYRCTHNPTHGL